MKKLSASIFALSLVMGFAAAEPAFAYQAGHPRINEVDTRLVRQTHRDVAGVKDGEITKRQAVRNEAADVRVAGQMRVDEARNGGKITPAEQLHFNQELDANGNRIYSERH